MKQLRKSINRMLRNPRKTGPIEACVERGVGTPLTMSQENRAAQKAASVVAKAAWRLIREELYPFFVAHPLAANAVVRAGERGGMGRRLGG